jgi:hypothetical protein
MKLDKIIRLITPKFGMALSLKWLLYSLASTNFEN